MSRRVAGRGLTLVFLALLLVGPFYIGVVAAQPVERVAVIIGFKEAADPSLVAASGGQVKYVYQYIAAVAAMLPSQAVEALEKNPKVAYVEPDFEVYALARPPALAKPPQPPPQPSQTIPWGISKIRAPEAWATSRGTEIKVAILDTGIDLKHPDLQVSGGVTYVWGTRSYNDDNGHGTHVAGIVAALGNEIGVVGVAPEAVLYAVKVLNRYGSGYISWIIAGIEWSITNKMQIISMSFGSTSDSSSLHAVCNKAYNFGIVLVAAAGNSGPKDYTVNYPAKYDSVIAVGAIDSTDTVASWSSRGPELSVAAPGVSIYSTYKGSTYATMSGTSMACPHVTGTVALILSKSPNLSPPDVRSILQTTAADLGPTGWDSAYGYGRIDAYKAVTATLTQ